MAGRGEPECRQLLLETVRIVPEGAWCGGTDGLSGTCAECEGDALPCLALRRGPRQMQNEPADRADDLDPELEHRSRSHVTWVRAHAVPAARSRSSCIST